MKTLRTIFIFGILVQGASAFNNASKKKNQIIVKEISLTTYSRLMGGSL